MTEVLNETTSGPAGNQPGGLKPWQLKRGDFTRVVDEIVEASERARAATPLSPMELSHAHDRLENCRAALQRAKDRFYRASGVGQIARAIKERDELEAKLEPLTKEWQAAEHKSKTRWDDGGKAMVALVNEKYPQWVEEGVIRIMPEQNPRRGDPYLTIASYHDTMREAIVLGKPVPLGIYDDLCSAEDSEKYMQNVHRIRLEREFARTNLAAILRDHHVNDLAQLGEKLKDGDDQYIVRVHLRDDTSLSALDPALKDPSRLEKVSAIGLSYAGESTWQWISLGKYAAAELAVEALNHALLAVAPERAYEMER